MSEIFTQVSLSGGQSENLQKFNSLMSAALEINDAKSGVVKLYPIID